MEKRGNCEVKVSYVISKMGGISPSMLSRPTTSDTHSLPWGSVAVSPGSGRVVYIDAAEL